MYGGGGTAHGRINGTGGYSFFGGSAARGHPRGGDYSRNQVDPLLDQVVLTDGSVPTWTRRKTRYGSSLGIQVTNVYSQS